MRACQTSFLLSKLGISLPIIQAPMAGGATTAKLVAAVSNAGGLGSIGAGYLAPAEIGKIIKETRLLTKQPFAVNLFIPQTSTITQNSIDEMNNILNSYRRQLNIPINPTVEKLNLHDVFAQQLEVVFEENVPIFSFTFGIPTANQMKRLKDNKIIIMGTATNVNEACQLEKAGCDAIVAQGSEAGGHRGSFEANTHGNHSIGTMALIPQIVDKVHIPVVGSGGIMDGRGLIAALALGASAVQMGTAFLTTIESGAHEKYKEAILKSHDDSTVITSVFSGKPARGIKNQFIEDIENDKDKIVDYPFQHMLTLDIRKEAGKQNRTEFMSLFAGQGTTLARNKPASQLIKEVMTEAEKILSNLNSVNWHA